MDSNRLAVFDAFLALDWAVEAEEAGDVAESKRLRNIATRVAAAVPPDAPPVDLTGDG